MRLFYLIVLYLLESVVLAVDLPIVDKPVQKPIDGQICGFGDMNKDRYTDLIVQNQHGHQLMIYLQDESGRFEVGDYLPITFNVSSGTSVCAVADFNGDSLPDIMVTRDAHSGDGKEVKVYLNNGTAFHITEQDFSTLLQPPTIVDLNGDGVADIVGFLERDSKFFCMQFNTTGLGQSCENLFSHKDSIEKPFKNFPHIFADITDDLSAEIIFALQGETDEDIVFKAWQLERIIEDKGIWIYKEDLITEMPKTGTVEHYGSGVVADFDGDGSTDILVPACRDILCEFVHMIMLYSPRKGWVYFQFDLIDSKLVVGKDGTIFHVGDFTLDGYPDLVATIFKNGQMIPTVFENVDYNGNKNFSRKFELMGPPKDAPFVMTKEMSFGKLQMTTFFDLKEDGSLDILVEYTEVDTRRLKFDFIHCDDKGDTTFLKVQVFTNVCTKNCKNSKATELGSGISWHGSCAYYTMADTSGNIQKGLQCQLPQTSQRALYVPSILFGLGRSPNFIDEVSIGSPRPSDDTSNQHFVLYQIVPNSRLIVVPPEGNEIHWNSRLYLTPNQLIIQSIVALASLCILLTILILLLHYHEHRQDVREKQAQLHRFHFDAM